MSQSYTYTPNPIPSNSPFSVTFNDNTGSINGLSTYNLETTDSTLLSSFNNRNQIFYNTPSPLAGPVGLAFDSSGNLYCANTASDTISKITTGGSISIFASSINGPWGLAFDSSGNLYCGSSTTNIYKITPAGIVSIFVTLSTIRPFYLAFDSSGNLYSSDIDDGSISKITPAGNISTFASGLNLPFGITFDSSGNLYCANNGDNTIIKITSEGSITTFASGLIIPNTLAFSPSGDLYCGCDNVINTITPGGIVTIFASNFYYPNIVFDSYGNLYSANTGDNSIIKINPTNMSLSTIVFSGLSAPAFISFNSLGNLYCINYNADICYFTPNKIGNIIFSSGSNPDLGPPKGIAFDNANNLYVSFDTTNIILKITAEGSITTFVSSGLTNPFGLACDSAGNLYCANNGNNTISKITTGGSVSTFASGLSSPYGLAFDSAGNLYCANSGNNTISKITTGGSVSTFASGLNTPYGLAFDSAGNLYCANNGNNTIRKITTEGSVSTFASGLNSPYGLAVDSTGNLYCANKNGNNIFVFETNQLVFTNVPSTNLATGVNTLNILYGSTQLNSSPILVTLLSGDIPCFKSGTKILTIRGYQPIESLRKGDMIETYNHGFVPIVMIGYSTIYNSGDSKRIKHRLYKCTNDAYSELTEDLIITGCHSILVNNFNSEEQKERTMETWNGEILITDDKYRLPACVDIRAKPYEVEGTFTIYHLALSHEDYYSNYGIYANGLLVETTSKRYLKELSNMKLIE